MLPPRGLWGPAVACTIAKRIFRSMLRLASKNFDVRLVSLLLGDVAGDFGSADDFTIGIPNR